MALMSAPKISKRKISQTINLKEEFGINFRGRDALKTALGQAIIDKIRARTESGEGVKFDSRGRGRSTKLKSPYSEAYAKSDEFKAFGKSKTKVNMKLTGDMLGLMDITKIDGNKLEIGWDDREETLKAYNHLTGDTVPQRPFFGISKSELKEIKKEFGREIKEALKDNEKQQELLKGLATRFLGDGESED